MFKCGDLSLLKYCAESNIRARASLLDSCNPFRPPHEHITKTSKQTHKLLLCQGRRAALRSVRQRSFGPKVGTGRPFGPARHWAACRRHELLPHLLVMKPLSDWERLLGEIVLEARTRTHAHAHKRPRAPTRAHARTRTPKQQARARALTGINARTRAQVSLCLCAVSFCVVLVELNSLSARVRRSGENAATVERCSSAVATDLPLPPGPAPDEDMSPQEAPGAAKPAEKVPVGMLVDLA